jgi:hypothetical protein
VAEVEIGEGAPEAGEDGEQPAGEGEGGGSDEG